MYFENNYVVDQKMSMKCRAVGFLAHPIWSARLQRVIELYNAFDRGLNEGLNLTSADSPALYRFMRFCVPFFEIQEALTRRELGREDEFSIASMFLWCEVWRPLDNLLDNEAPVTESIQELIQSYSRAERFLLQQREKNFMPTFGLYEKVFENIGIERDISRRSSYDEIYVRALIFENFLLGRSYPDNTINAHREYINITGFIHDFVDLIYDFDASKITYPKRIWQEIGDDLSFSRRKINKYITRCDEHICEKIELFKKRFNVPPPITMCSISDTYEWAFA